MADDDPKRNEQPEDRASTAGAAEGTSRPVPGGPGARTEKALGLEVARLFGMNPRLLMTPASPPVGHSAGDDRAATEPGRDENDQRPPSDSSPQASDP